MMDRSVESRQLPAAAEEDFPGKGAPLKRFIEKTLVEIDLRGQSWGATDLVCVNGSPGLESYRGRITAGLLTVQVVRATNGEVESHEAAQVTGTLTLAETALSSAKPYFRQSFSGVAGLKLALEAAVEFRRG